MALKIKKLEASDTSNEIICNAFLMTEIASFEELIRTCDEDAKKFPDASLLISFDEIGDVVKPEHLG